MEVPGLGVELELQLLAYTAATATWDPSCVYDLHHLSTTVLDPQPTEQGLHPYGSWLGLLTIQPQRELSGLFNSRVDTVLCGSGLIEPVIWLKPRV